MMYIRLYMDLSTDNKSFNLTFGKVSKCFLLTSGSLILTADWRCSVTSLWCCNAHVSWCNRYHYVRHWSEPCVCSLLMFLFSKRFPKAVADPGFGKSFAKNCMKMKELDRKGGWTPPGSADEKYGNISEHYHTIRITEKCSLNSPRFFSFRWTEYISKFWNLSNKTEQQHSEIHDLMLLIPQARVKCMPTITRSFSYLTVLYVKDSRRTVYLQLSCFEKKIRSVISKSFRVFLKDPGEIWSRKDIMVWSKIREEEEEGDEEEDCDHFRS